MGVTLKQIADMAGVHKSTVDKVIHNRPGVSDKTRQKIRRLLEEQGYESNPLAKALNYQKNKMRIAVVMPNVDARDDLKRGMEVVRQDFNSFNFEVFYYGMPFSDAREQARCLRELAQRDVSGVVLLPIEDPIIVETLQELKEKHIPVILVNSDLERAEYLCYVGQNMEQAGRVAARLFALCLMGQQGRLGVITSNYMSGVKQREFAFRRYLQEQYPEIQLVDTVDIIESEAYAYENTKELLQQHPDLNALFITCGCVPDICRAVRDMGLAGKLVVISYERYPEIEELIQSNEITCTISSDLFEQGQTAMRTLFEYFVYDHQPEEQTIYTRNEILFRENIK